MNLKIVLLKDFFMLLRKVNTDFASQGVDQFQ